MKHTFWLACTSACVKDEQRVFCVHHFRFAFSDLRFSFPHATRNLDLLSYSLCASAIKNDNSVHRFIVIAAYRPVNIFLERNSFPSP